MFSGLFPGATFARRTSCLGGLTILMETYGSLRSSGNMFVGVFISLKYIVLAIAQVMVLIQYL